MAGLKQIALLIFLLLLCKNTISIGTEAENDSKETLVESESKDGKLEIIKQIKKINDDGSYTIGYEADDGSFKIESRDVLGNIKGTYGYLDEGGQIKRVSYSTSNSSDIFTKPEVSSSVVQRIPKHNKTITTKKPFSSYTTTPSTTTSNVIQRIAKYRNNLSSSTTDKPNYGEVVNMDSETSKTTVKPAHLLYSTSASPRILLQGRPILRSTATTNIQTQKSEGQLIRPEVTARPTELPSFRRLALKQSSIDENKPVIEETETRNNILRRQLEKSTFDPQQHVFNIQQSLGSDSTDVYSASVTTGTPRPLFTTTSRPRALLSSTTAPVIITRPTVRYPVNEQRIQTLETSTPEYRQETTTTEATTQGVTPTSIPVVQIPANRAEQDPLVAIRHPFQRNPILIPLSQIQNRLVPFEQLREIERNPPGQFNEPVIKETLPRPPPPEIEPRPLFVRRLPPPQFRPIPVQVDEHGFIRDIPPQNIRPTPYSLPVPITPGPKYVNENDIPNDIDTISPPVSTRDFQKLLQQLILRQTRLERISELTDPRRNPEFYPPMRPYRPTPLPYYVQRLPETQQNGPIQFLTEQELQQKQRQYVAVPQQQPQQQQVRQIYYNPEEYTDSPQSFTPTRRVARLLPSSHVENKQPNEEFLPPDVREMLLLRMLQLAINPALPLADIDVAESTTPAPQFKKGPVRNVEILGEETAETKSAARSKRFRGSEINYYES